MTISSDRYAPPGEKPADVECARQALTEGVLITKRRDAGSAT